MIGRDFDVAVKESFNLMSKFRREIEVVHEDFRAAGMGLAEAVLRTIAGTARHRPADLGRAGLGSGRHSSARARSQHRRFTFIFILANNLRS